MTKEEMLADVRQREAEAPEPERKLIGLHLCEDRDGWAAHYDIGLIAAEALEALRVAVLAVEQVVTGEKLVKSLDVGDFYAAVSRLLEEESGQGVLADSGDVGALQEELREIAAIVRNARFIAKRPRWPR